MKNIERGIRFLVMVVFLGYIMIWIMMPTNTFYLHWSPLLHSKTDSTFFSNQGVNILIYIFPILLIAILSGLCLHLSNKNVNNNSQRLVEGDSRLRSWKQPVFVKGPLGIVSWIELSFLTMFLALLVWSFSSYLHAMFATISKEAAQNPEINVWEAKLQSTGLVFGFVGNICLGFLLFPVTRGSSILQLIGLTSEGSIKYHIWLGHTAMTFFTAHAFCYILFWSKTYQISQMGKWEKIGISNLAGEVGLLCGMVMWATSFKAIRRKIFELFYYTHHLYLLFIVFFVFHVGFSNSYVIVPGFYLFFIDRFLRFLQSQQKVGLLSARVLPCGVEFTFLKSRGLAYNPTSIMFVNVPCISKLQWHPFTITSSSNMETEKLSIFIKSEGSWSRNLHQKLSSSSPLNCLEVSIEGPYGPATTTSLLRHEKLVLVSGGSGITPFISIIRDLLFKANTESTNKTPSILFIGAFKKSQDLTMLDLLIPVSGTNLQISRFQLQIEAYVTRENKPATNNRPKLVQTIWFKPNPFDSPVCAVLGPNSWVWLGIVISSSFVIFLLILGIITRYYIYPVDHNSEMVYSYTLRSGINMLLICVSIVIAATAAFVWNKIENCKEKRQVQNMEVVTPMDSCPIQELCNGDRELESLPNQSLALATKVHYGERPDLKGILSKFAEGSSTGVLVSGPKKMRQEVAAICASKLGKNLIFESISFSW